MRTVKFYLSRDLHVQKRLKLTDNDLSYRHEKRFIKRCEEKKGSSPRARETKLKGRSRRYIPQSETWRTSETSCEEEARLKRLRLPSRWLDQCKTRGSYDYSWKRRKLFCPGYVQGLIQALKYSCLFLFVFRKASIAGK